MPTNDMLEVREFSIRNISIPITGISPLIVHRWSEKARKEILDKEMGKAKSRKREIKVPKEDFEAAKHKSPLGWEGFPAAGFKAAMIRGAKSLGMVMKDVQTAFFVKADCEQTQLIKINGAAQMREDMVRVGNGGASVRFRPEYLKWDSELIIEFNEGSVSKEQILQLVRAAGYGCGIGEMRPEKGKFNYGRFDIDYEKLSSYGKK